MSCEPHMEGLQNFAKQLEEQKATIVSQIQSLDAQLAQAFTLGGVKTAKERNDEAEKNKPE